MDISSIRRLLFLASFATMLTAGSLMLLVEQQAGAVFGVETLELADEDGESDDLLLRVDSLFLETPAVHSPAVVIAVSNEATIIRGLHDPRAPPLA